MTLLLISLVFCVFCETPGFWVLEFMYEKECIDDIRLASKVTDECVNIPGGSGGSFRYECDVSTGNVTLEAYPETDCEGSPKEEHLGDVDKCTLDKKKGVYYWMKCSDDYELKFPRLEFEVGMFSNETNIGTDENPEIGEVNLPLLKCVQFHVFSRFHFTFTCGEDQVGTIEAFEGGLCLHAHLKKTAKPGEIVDMTKFLRSEEKIFWKYTGCTNHYGQD